MSENKLESVDLFLAAINPFVKNNTVENVSVNGDSSFDSYDYFEPDAKIIITYH